VFTELIRYTMFTPLTAPEFFGETEYKCLSAFEAPNFGVLMVMSFVGELFMRKLYWFDWLFIYAGCY
jgi:hypothetical protein